MPENIQPSNPNTPISQPQPGNIASLVNKDTLTTLKGTISPKAFGDQLKDQAKQKAIQAASESTLAKLLKEKASLIQEEIQLDIQHQNNLLKLQLQNKPGKKIVNGQPVETSPQLSDEEYNIAVANENKNYEEEKKNIQLKKEQNQKSIDDILKDPFKKQKEARKKRKEERAKRKARTKDEKKKARREKRKAVLQNARKTLVPTLALLLTDKIAEVIAQNDKIKKLVDDTNAIITDANESGDPTKLDNAKLARDNAIKIIQNNENKIIQIANQINRISIYINVFSIIVNSVGPTILSIPVPPSPPGDIVTSPKERFRRRVYEPALKLLQGLSALLPIISLSLQKAVDILNDYKSQLLQINGIIDPLTTPPQINFGTGAGTNAGFDEYKGFKFALKEENNPDRKFVIRGNKRHYAVAINSDNVEVLKSELSFTLDPNDLIEQLKLVIDQRNLQG